MNIHSSLPRRLYCLSLFLCAAVVHADAGRPLEFSLDPAARPMDHSLSSWQGVVIGPELANGVLMILGGVVGNVVGLYAGGVLGILVPSGGNGIAAGPVLGALAGSACGSAMGVYFAGSGGGRRGKFGSALLGSLLGEAAAAVVAVIVPSRRDSEFSFLPGFLILPPLGAALVFNSSMASRSVRAGNGLFNLAGGRLGLGVPDVHIRPVMVPGCRAKQELQFKVNVLSVEL
jgi:hypothetical protein